MTRQLSITLAAHRCLAIGCIALIATLTINRIAPAEQTDSLDRDYSADLKRLPPTSTDRALNTFEVEPGFKLELAAGEPQVTDPVAMEFDEQGRLYVVEMLGYSENADDMLGRIRLLEDEDRDGTFEKSTVFADGLGWPTAVICYDGGVFVGAAPEILYFKDTTGDGKSDERRTAFTGFGTDNVQGLLNSFRWGLDNRIHVAVSRNGAELRRGDQPNAEPLVLRGRNFAFDPRTLEFEATSGASQHGFCFDDFGNAFTCHNSDHIQQILIEDRYLSRNPFIRPPAVLKSIGVEGAAADVYRISPVEPWREIRTRLRVSGIAPGMIEGGGRAAGYFTSATGVTIYTGDAWPREFHGNAFIGDVGSNLVHRKIIERDPNAIPFIAKRATPNREFIASTDTWFRPVQFANGPDGNLYVLDMYREVIEHPASLPPVLKKHLDLTSGRDRGRIYRVIRADASPSDRRQSISRVLPGKSTSTELVTMLGHPNGWHRTTAARLLFERNDPSSHDMLRHTLGSVVATPQARVLAMNLLASFEVLTDAGLVQALSERDSNVCDAAVRLAGDWLAKHRPNELLRGRADRPNDSARERVAQKLGFLSRAGERSTRYWTALTLAEPSLPRRLEDLAAILRAYPDDEYITAAVYSSLANGADKLVGLLLEEAEFSASPAGRRHVIELCRQIGARASASELTAIAQQIATAPGPLQEVAGEMLMATLRGAGAARHKVSQQIATASKGKSEQIVSARLESSLKVAADEAADPAARVAAIATLPLGQFQTAEVLLSELLAPRHPQNVQLAALAAFGEFRDADVAPIILAAYGGMGPTLRLQAAELLISRSATAKALLAAVDSGELTARDLDPSTIQRLKTHADVAVCKQAATLLQDAAPKRTDVVDAHQDVLQLTGDAARGRDVFKNNCAICHRKNGEGVEVGADLATVATRSPDVLLMSILDPNREVDPKFVQYTVLTFDGLVKSGMIASETATSVTLKRQENVTETIPRADIEQLTSTKMTLMPEGFEKQIDKQSLADLIAYLRTTDSP